MIGTTTNCARLERLRDGALAEWNALPAASDWAVQRGAR
jgi:hypothetical protein